MVVKLKGLEGQVGEQVGSQQSQKSTGKKRTHYRARSASSSARQRGLVLVCSLATSGAPSKWSYQIVFPLDGSRFTVAALVLFLCVETKEVHSET